MVHTRIISFFTRKLVHLSVYHFGSRMFYLRIFTADLGVLLVVVTVIFCCSVFMLIASIKSRRMRGAPHH